MIRFNPIPTRQGRNQPLYERHVTKSGRNRVKYKSIEKKLSVNIGKSIRVLMFKKVHLQLSQNNLSPHKQVD